MSDQQREIRSLSREWAAARIIIIAGFVLALGAGGYYAWQAREIVTNKREQVLAAVKAEQAQENAIEASDVAGEALCRSALAHAQNIGIIPSYGQLTAYEPTKSDTKGRYICLAATSASKYAIAADVLCRNMKDAKCVSLFAVTADGAVLYQRHG
ncbi:MAG TPA: hypothetical protein VLW75_10045 [Rhizomicrobium sp.]|nr:hypothetical protein [Rhizomicrobium sp.]